MVAKSESFNNLIELWQPWLKSLIKSFDNPWCPLSKRSPPGNSLPKKVLGREFQTPKRYSQLSPCGHPAIALRTLAITDKIQIPNEQGLTGKDSRYYGLSLKRTRNDAPSVSAITRVDCIHTSLSLIKLFCVIFLINMPCR